MLEESALNDRFGRRGRTLDFQELFDHRKRWVLLDQGKQCGIGAELGLDLRTAAGKWLACRAQDHPPF